MSTFNGRDYLIDQVQSILDQDWIEGLRLIIRDDGSTDTTLDILSEIPAPNAGVEIKIIKGENIGVIESFLFLCRSIAVDPDDLIYFSDQDDVWCAGRVNRVSEIFNLRPEVGVYCGALQSVDSKLRPIGLFDHLSAQPSRQIFPPLVNHITGCSLVIRGSSFLKLNFDVDPSSILMHDWWVALQAYYYSIDCYYDTQYTVLYRQHSNNVVGVTPMLRKVFSCRYWRSRLKSDRSVQIRSVETGKITDPALLIEKKCFDKYASSFLGRIIILMKYFGKAGWFSWLVFVLAR